MNLTEDEPIVLDKKAPVRRPGQSLEANCTAEYSSPSKLCNIFRPQREPIVPGQPWLRDEGKKEALSRSQPGGSRPWLFDGDTKASQE